MNQSIPLTEAELSILKRLERIPFGRVQWRLLWMGGMGYTFDAMDGAMIVIGYTFRQIGFDGVFVITTIVLVIGALAVAWLGIGTAGKSLEQITAEELRRAGR